MVIVAGITPRWNKHHSFSPEKYVDIFNEMEIVDTVTIAAIFIKTMQIVIPTADEETEEEKEEEETQAVVWLQWLLLQFKSLLLL